MGPQDRGFARLAAQLAGPHGLAGRAVARQLDKANRIGITAAVHLLDPAAGAVVADIGFGGGIGLDLLHEAVGADGVVHGVDPMADMVRRARRRRRAMVRAGDLVLHQAWMHDLPLPDDTLEGAISCNTIYFMTDLTEPFADVARVLRPGGALVIGLADPDDLRQRPFSDHGFVIREVAEVVDALIDAGLTPGTTRTVDIGRGAFHVLRADAAG